MIWVVNNFSQFVPCLLTLWSFFVCFHFLILKIVFYLKFCSWKYELSNSSKINYKAHQSLSETSDQVLMKVTKTKKFFLSAIFVYKHLCSIYYVSGTRWFIFWSCIFFSTLLHYKYMSLYIIIYNGLNIFPWIGPGT